MGTTAINISDEGTKSVTLTPKTAGGKATTIDTSDRQPTATVVGDTDAEASVEVVDGKLVVKVQGEVAEGENFSTHEIEVDADADKDPGEDRSIKHTIIATITRAEAASMDAEVGEEVPREAAGV